MLRFQQVTVESVLFISVNYIFIFQAGLTATEVRFKEEGKGNGKGEEPLLMEHFSLPIGLWFVGTLITIICFLAEIYIYKKEATQKEPSETQTESETSQRNLPDTEGAEGDQVQGSEVPARVTFQQEDHHNTDVQDIEVVEEIEDKKMTLTT